MVLFFPRRPLRFRFVFFGNLLIVRGVVTYLRIVCAIRTALRRMLRLHRDLLALAMPVDRGLHALIHECHHHIRANDLLSECFLLEELQMSQCRAGIGKVFEIRRLAPVLEICKICNKGGLAEELLGCKMVEVGWVCKGLNELRNLVLATYG